MQLIGQYDSPFVRRVGIALARYGVAFEHLPWSTFGDWQKFAHQNPLRRVPCLVLDSGEALIDMLPRQSTAGEAAFSATGTVRISSGSGPRQV